jgi:hypothetical protein
MATSRLLKSGDVGWWAPVGVGDAWMRGRTTCECGFLFGVQFTI